jgi:hypothetical protein
MEIKKKTPKEVASIIEKTITEIRKNKVITNKIIKETCKKYDINENHIRKVAGFSILKKITS